MFDNRSKISTFLILSVHAEEQDTHCEQGETELVEENHGVCVRDVMSKKFYGCLVKNETLKKTVATS